MKKKCKKGFTIVEILAVIVVLAILMVIATPVITGTSSNAKKKTYETMTSMIESAAILYGQDNYRTLKDSGLPTEEEYIVKAEISLATLIPEYYKPEDYDNLSATECKVRRPIDNACIDGSTITIKINTYSKKVTAEFNEVIS